jgi:hypothetical protein
MTHTRTYVRCAHCGERAPHGDERFTWLGWHESWHHRAWWWLRKRLGDTP